MALDRPSLLAQASAPVLARIRGHRDQLEFPGRGLLVYLLDHVYDPDLKVASWRRACKIKGVTAVHQVQAVIGTTLGVYLEELRVETAMRLLVVSHGELPCSEVGVLAGYGREATFREIFVRHTELTPGVYRQRVLSLRELGRRPPDPAWVRSGWLERFVEGRLEPAATLAVVEEVEAAHGLSPTATSPEPPIETWEDYERHVARTWWSRARKLPVAQLSEQVLRGFEDQTPALCRELLRRVEEESRQDPAFGLETAELALEQATLLKPHLDPAELANLLACTWAWLGWARRCAGDPGGAAQAFARAETCLAEHAAPPAVIAEVWRLAAG